MLGLGNSISLSSALSAAPGVGEIEPAKLKVWLKRGTGQTTSGGKLTNWADSSGNSNFFSQSTASNRPSISGDEVTFDGTINSFLFLGSSFGVSQLNLSAFTFMFVLNPNESVTLDDEFIFGVTGRDGAVIYKDEDTSRVSINKNDSQTVIDGSINFPTGDNDFLLTVTRAGNGNIAIRINGSESGTGTSNISNLFDLITIGMPVGGSDTGFNGQINEVVVYDIELGGSDLTNAENDVMNRSGI